MTYGEGDDLGAVLNVQFVENVAEVRFDCVLGDHQSLGELAVAGDALHEQVKHFAFPLRECRQAFERVCVCGYDADLRAPLKEIEEKLGLSAQRVEPSSVEDVYKPVLGAIHLRAEAVL